MSTDVVSRCRSLPSSAQSPSTFRDHVDSMTSSRRTSGHEDEASGGEAASAGQQQQQQKEQRLSFSISQILQSDDDRRRRPGGRDSDVISGSGGCGGSGNGDDATASTIALIRSAFGSYVLGQQQQPGATSAIPAAELQMVPGTATGGLYGTAAGLAATGVIRVPAQRLSDPVAAAAAAAGGICVGQHQAPSAAVAAAAAACRLSAMMFPWMRERKDGLTCTHSTYSALQPTGPIII